MTEQSASSAIDAAAEVGEQVTEHPAYRWLVTVGLVCYGFVHVLLAWLTLGVLRGKGVDASNQGSIATLADLPAGRVMVAAVGVGMLALSLWQALEAAFGYPWLHGKKLVVRKVASAFRAVVYLTIGFGAVKLSLTGAIANGNASGRSTSRGLLDLPGGTILVFLIGVGILIAAIDQVQRGARKSFVKYDMQGDVPGWAVKLGIVGWITKGVTLALVALGFFLAAIQHNANQAGGLDAALKDVRGTSQGQLALAVIAFGFFCFGIFCFVWSQNARHDVTSD